MRLEDYIEYGGIEIANGNRSRDYMDNGLVSGIAIASAGCGCSTVDDGPYENPANDPAPWYDSTRQESREFLGLIASDVRLDSVAIHSVTPKVSHGATIGRVYFKHRIVSVTGLLIAGTAQGMAYGERWMADVLASNVIGCSPGSLRILLACPTGGAVPQFRTLRRVGIVDGPNYGQMQELPECYMQSIQFQLVAGVPWLLADEISCLSETVL